MTYIPKNRIKTDLFTNGGELLIASTGIAYTGFYWKDFTGKFFTGKNPNDTPTEELIPPPPPEEGSSSSNTSYSSLIIDDLTPPNVQNYMLIKNQSEDSLILKLPSQFFPKPTQEEYNLGVFTRYFVVKQNQSVYTEVDESTYNNIINRNEEWDWSLFTAFKLPWTLTGEKQQVAQTNKNITLLTQQKLGKKGLPQFLRENYLKFYLET